LAGKNLSDVLACQPNALMLRLFFDNSDWGFL
jgi:hypothetical protein